jgi:AraC-like DNA-binding protein
VRSTQDDGTILLLTPDAAGASRFRAAFGARLRTFESQALLLEASRRPDADLVIVPWRDHDGGSLVATVAAIRASRRSPPVLIHVDRGAECLHAVVSLSRAGATGVIVRDVDDDVRSLRHLLDRGSVARATETVMFALRRVIHERHLPLFVICLEQLHDPLPASTFARRLRVSRRTLSTWSRKAGAKGMRSLASKCRVLVAIEVIRESNRTLEQVAHVLRFASAAHLHNTIRRYTGAAPRQAAMQDPAEWCRVLFTTKDHGPPGDLEHLPGKAGVLPRNGRIDLTTRHLPHATGNVPGETMQ